jgi:phosphatidylserine/phosphatidylglycerophosphate/cardiolipin synthase-like enzyme
MMSAFFGGPDKPPGLLRDLLLARIDGVPAGGEILWATYYFCDMDLADALIRARRRGVVVNICIERFPRIRSANESVRIRLAAADALGEGFRSISHFLPGHLHEKIYFFSHPSPAALIGSFNPSGNRSGEAAIIEDIGDQDRGHNYLVEIREPPIVEPLRRHILWLMTSQHTVFERYRPEANNNPRTGELNLFFFPRRDSGVLLKLLAQHRYVQVRVAASHFRDGSVAQALARLAQSGTSIEVIAHHTERRVPERIERSSRRAGIQFHRYRHPRVLPMHSKFILLTAPGFQRVLFGSMNLTRTSRWLNHEVLVEAAEPGLFGAFNERWERMLAEIRDFETTAGVPDACPD